MEEHLPKLEPIVTLPHQNSATFGKTKSYVYYKALHDLKEVSRQLNTVNNRIRLLTSKQIQAKHPISEYFEQRGKKMRSMAREWNQKSQQQLKKIKEREDLLINNKMVRNEEVKMENSRRKEQAKRMIAQEKYKSHDSVRECSLQNKKAIQNAKIKSFIKKKQKHGEVVEFEKRSRNHLRQLSLSRISSLIESREAQTNKILNKLKQKQKILVEKKEECFLKEASLEKIIKQKRKPKKAHPRRMFTEETKSTVLFGTDVSGTPKSALSFVIIP